MQKSLPSESRSSELPCFSRLVKERAFWLSWMCRHGTTWQMSMEEAALCAGVVRNGVLCPSTPQIYWKAKGTVMSPFLSHHTQAPANLLPVHMWSSSEELCGSLSPIYTVTPTLTHMWVCKLGPEDTMRRRPSARVSTTGSW